MSHLCMFIVGINSSVHILKQDSQKQALFVNNSIVSFEKVKIFLCRQRIPESSCARKTVKPRRFQIKPTRVNRPVKRVLKYIPHINSFFPVWLIIQYCVFLDWNYLLHFTENHFEMSIFCIFYQIGMIMTTFERIP